MKTQNNQVAVQYNRLTIFVLILASMLILVILTGCSASSQNAPPGEITGRVYLDDDADGECDECGCDFFMEGINIQLYQGTCGGVVHQTTSTDPDGIYRFSDLPPGDYCLSPKVKTICEGYQPTTPIQQKVVVVSNQTVEAPWFGFDYNLEPSE